MVLVERSVPAGALVVEDGKTRNSKLTKVAARGKRGRAEHAFNEWL